LVVNLAVQIFIGIPLEMVHGWWRVLLIYVTGVVAGSLGTSMTDPMSKLAGASGGVYSLITAHIATIILVSGGSRSRRCSTFCSRRIGSR
jgi:rhomboid-related protein 1/2/3